MKSINSRIYLDYNATSPFADSVKEFLAKGDFLFANPSSLHASGKKARREINQVIEKIFSIFNFSEQGTHDLIFHSGATEGINLIVKGYFLPHMGEELHFFCAETDHSCVVNQFSFLNKIGVKTHLLPVNQDGGIDLAIWVQQINSVKGKKLLNFTWVQNETGVVWPLSLAKEIKEKTDIVIHVDAVQTPGKIENWSELSSLFEAYTYSAHKFGGLKGTGLSFISKNLKLSALADGGAQQTGLRPGTENLLGATAIALALLEIKESADFLKVMAFRGKIESLLFHSLKRKYQIVGINSKRATNTICFIADGIKADSLLMNFDLAGVDLSTVSACSSGTVSPSRVLLAMGHTEDEARASLRLSLPWSLKNIDEEKTLEALAKIIG